MATKKKAAPARAVKAKIPVNEEALAKLLSSCDLGDIVDNMTNLVRSKEEVHVTSKPEGTYGAVAWAPLPLTSKVYKIDKALHKMAHYYEENENTMIGIEVNAIKKYLGGLREYMWGLIEVEIPFKLLIEKDKWTRTAKKSEGAITSLFWHFHTSECMTEPRCECEGAKSSIPLNTVALCSKEPPGSGGLSGKIGSLKEALHAMKKMFGGDDD